MLIVWGTKVRLREQGCRADFCEECLLVSKTIVSGVEQIGHLYYIPIGFYKEKHRIGECEACGRVTEVLPASSLVPKNVRCPEMMELVARTNPHLLEQLPTLADSIDVAFSAKERTYHVLENFSCRANQVLDDARSGITGWLGLLMILLAFPVAMAFAISDATGWVASVASLLAVLWVRKVLIHRRSTRILSKRLSILLPSSGITWNQLEQHLLNSGKSHKRLSKHLAKGCYMNLSLELSRLDVRLSDSNRLNFPSRAA
ncbi:hypothetical protein FHS27_003230 [Rhodopirellula rubra]|uniref:Uncharacterized protein n=1 Tax=Aporhodopirellula rubra TaxID=980271 RepID=A0A7W5E078_9BACT|nr:hypothetical protein [Aporhodopirellula rubra]